MHHFIIVYITRMQPKNIILKSHQGKSVDKGIINLFDINSEI